MKQACFMEANSLHTRWQKLHLWGPKKRMCEILRKITAANEKSPGLVSFHYCLFLFSSFTDKINFLVLLTLGDGSLTCT